MKKENELNDDELGGLTKYQIQYQKRKARQSEAKKLNINGIQVGETYGNYEVLEKIKVPHKVSRGNGVYVDCMMTKWKCRYIPDGSIKITTTGYLSEFKTAEQIEKSLNDLVENNQHQKGFRNYLYKTYKTNAGKRKHEFHLTQEEFENIISQNCHYCGEPPKPMSEELRINRGNPNQPLFYYNGVDRLDSNGDYTTTNCVPCCSMCNYMKNIYSYDEFLTHIKRIYRYLNLGSETIPIGSTSQAKGDGNGEPLTDNAEGEDIVRTV